MSHINISNESDPSIEPWATPEGTPLASQELKKAYTFVFFACDYWNNLVYLVNLCQHSTHVIWQSKNRYLSNQKPPKGQLIMHRKFLSVAPFHISNISNYEHWTDKQNHFYILKFK